MKRWALWIVSMACCSPGVFGLPAAAADLWVDAADPEVSTGNSCGSVVEAWGESRIRRAFMTDGEHPDAVGVSDRLDADDEIETSGGGRVELAAGDNVLVLVGPDSRVRLLGRRFFTGADGINHVRLDLSLLRGEARIQVRLNETNPEAAMIEVGGQTILLTRGDVAATAGKEWMVASLGGGAECRFRQGTVTGPSVVLDAGGMASADGVRPMSGEEMEAIRARLPFSFEIRRAALPPLPPPDPYDEAP